jgi:hypothetical protein
VGVFSSDTGIRHEACSGGRDLGAFLCAALPFSSAFLSPHLLSRSHGRQRSDLFVALRIVSVLLQLSLQFVVCLFASIHTV